VVQDVVWWWALVNAVIKHLDFIKGREFFDQLRDYQLLKKVLNELYFWTLSIIWCLKN
jgi:hypothetical protein